MRSTCVLVSLIAACFSGCVESPNLVFVTKGGIEAQGGISWKRDHIDFIRINPRELSESQIRDFWVGLSPSEQVTFAEITEEAIKKVCVPATNYHSAANPGTYRVSGYEFCFRGGQFVAFGANRYGYPPKNITAFVKLGSRQSGSSLSLPCGVDDFEKVFGKADSVKRGFGW